MNKLMIGSWILAAIAGLACGYLYFELGREESQNSLLDTRLSALESSHSNSTSAPLTGMPVASDAAPTFSSLVLSNAPTEITPKKPSRGERLREALRERLNDKDSRAEMKGRQKLALMRANPNLASVLHLRPEEADKLFNLLAEQRMKSMTKNMDLSDSLRAQNVSREDINKQLRQNADKEKAETDKQVATLLGDAKGQEWKDYESSRAVRSQVNGLGTILQSSGMPLGSDQTETLVKALQADRSSQTSSEPTDTISSSDGSITIDPNQRIAQLEDRLSKQEQQARQQHDTLAQYLTPEQLKRSDEITKQRLDSQRAALQKLRDRQPGANGS